MKVPLILRAFDSGAAHDLLENVALLLRGNAEAVTVAQPS
jgi:hypothetical protein